KANITLNKNMVPFDTESPFVTSGIRIGSPAMTSRGFGENEFKKVAELIDRVLQDPDSKTTLSDTRNEVTAMCRNFPLYDFVTAYGLAPGSITGFLVVFRFRFFGNFAKFIDTLSDAPGQFGYFSGFKKQEYNT